MTCTPEPRVHRGAAVLAALALAVLPLGGHAESAPLAEANRALEKGDSVAAEMILRRALKAGAERPDIAAAMGEAYFRRGDFITAREWLEPGKFSRSEAGRGYHLLGQVEHHDGDLAAAGRAYHRALALQPGNAVLWVDIGRLRYAGGEQVQAVDAADRALALAPGNIAALQFRAELIRDAYGLAAALPWFEAALATAPDDVPLLGEYAATLGEVGRTKEMLATTRHMLELTPGNAQAYFLQAQLAARAGNNAVARSLLNRTKGAFARRPAGLLLEGVLEFRAGNNVRAVELFDRLTTIQPANPRARMLLARALYDDGQHDRLLREFLPLAQRADASPYLLTLVGRALEEQGRRDAAAPLLDRAALAAAKPLSPILVEGEGDLALVRWLIGNGRASDAAIAAERLRHAHPGNGAAQAVAGDAQLVLGNYGAAIERYRFAGQIRATDGLLLRMNAALGAAGHSEEAARFAERYLAANPGNQLGTRLVAAYAAGAGKWEVSGTLLQRIAHRDGSRDARLLADLSFARLRGGEAADALEYAEQAYRLQRMSPVTTQAYAMALAADTKHAALARQLLDKAKRIGGDNPLLQETRAALK